MSATLRPAYREPVARLPRSVFPDGTFHVVSRGVEHSDVFLDERDRLSFLGLLAEVTVRFRWKVHALCLMTTHYHLVVEAARTDLSAGLHRLNGRYAQRFNTRRGRWGHLFGDRFWCGLIESERHLAATCAYVVANPVRAGLCETPPEWPWSHSRYGFDLEP